MNLRTVPSAGLLGEGSVAVATGAQDRFIPQYALPVVWRLQYHLSLRRDDQSTALSVTLKEGEDDLDNAMALSQPALCYCRGLG